MPGENVDGQRAPMRSECLGPDELEAGTALDSPSGNQAIPFPSGARTGAYGHFLRA